ncbi:hypothetical protein BGP_2647 [Beggiatoa sp. PS]|nr:hypothetical protein BGP_2647 [Beggiatoa sp. PS]
MAFGDFNRKFNAKPDDPFGNMIKDNFAEQKTGWVSLANPTYLANLK